jgi:hypothetical protein
MLIHPEALDCHFMRGRFLGIVLIRSHEKRAAGNPHHVWERRLIRVRFRLFGRSHGHAIAHNFFLSVVKANFSLVNTPKLTRGSPLSFRPTGEIFLRSLAFARDDGPRPSLSVVEGAPSTQRIAQAEVCLSKNRNPVYWTLVQYEQGYRSLREIEIRSTQIRLRHKASDGSASARG